MYSYFVCTLYKATLSVAFYLTTMNLILFGLKSFVYRCKLCKIWVNCLFEAVIKGSLFYFYNI